MRLSTKGEYALRAILDLKYHGDESVVRLEDIATRQKISLNYLERIFGKLKKAGIVGALRGPSGGYALNKDPKDIKIIDILIAAGDNPLKKPKSKTVNTRAAAKVYKLLSKIDKAMMEQLNRTLDDL